MVNSHLKGIKEEIAVEIIERLFAKKANMRIVIAPHPIHGKALACVPYLDLSEALTVPKDTIYHIISRSKRVRRYCGIYIMSTPGGHQATLCVFEEGILHIIMKLQPSRCQDSEVGNRLDALQDELIQLLRDILHGYYQRNDGKALSNAKTLCQLISVANKTQDKEYRDILNQQIEALSGKKISRPVQKALGLKAEGGLS